MDIQTTVIYRCYIKYLKFGPLTNKSLNKLFQDGRITSRFIEILLPKYFKQIKVATNSNVDYDLVSDTGEYYEEKTLTKNGLKLIPSGMIGVGRKFSEIEFKKRITKLNYYIICDIVNFPIIEIIFICSETIDCKIDYYSYKKARNLFFNNKTYIDL